MPTQKINGNSIFYEDSGSGQPLVLISGLGSTHFLWWKQKKLADRYRIIALDNRGVGDSSPVTGSFSVADMADDVAGLIQALNLGSCYIMGISMGGFISLSLTLRHPEKVKKLILVSTSAGGKTHVPPPREMLDLLIRSDFPDVETRTRAVYSAITAPDYMQNHPEDLDRIVQNAKEKPLSIESYLYQLEAVNNYSTKSGTDRELSGITAPTLVIHGDIDPLVSYQNGRYLAAHIKGARLETYEGVGHIPPVEASSRFNQDVMTFFG